MKITAKRLRHLIRKCMLRESREIKQQFYNQVRSKYPDIDRAFFVRWNRTGSRPTPDWERAEGLLNEILDTMRNNPGTEVACNLVDPSGSNTDPNSPADSFGPVGIVLQGIPIAGFKGNVGSDFESIDDGNQLRIRYHYTGHSDYDAERDLFTDFDGVTHFDKTVAEPFLVPQNMIYSDTEFGLVPKKIVGIVYHVDYNDITDRDNILWPGAQNHDLDTLKRKMRELGARHGIPVAIGKDEIRDFYRSLYGNTQVTQTLVNDDDDIDF